MWRAMEEAFLVLDGHTILGVCKWTLALWCCIDVFRWWRINRSIQRLEATPLSGPFDISSSDGSVPDRFGSSERKGAVLSGSRGVEELKGCHNNESVQPHGKARYDALVRNLFDEEPDVLRFVRGMFCGLELSKIPRKAVVASLAYYLGSCDECVEVSAGAVAEAERVLKKWQEQAPSLGQLVESGCHEYDRAEFCRAHLDKFRLYVHFRPLPIQLGIDAVLFYKRHIILRRAGFTPFPGQDGLMFWIRKGTSPRAKNPVYFLHGLGAGVAPYTSCVARHLVTSLPERTIVMPEILNLTGCMRYEANGTFPTPRQFADNLHSHLRSISADGSVLPVADVMSHSFGTVLQTYWRRHYPADCRRRLYVDPMCVGVTFGGYISYGYEPYLSSVGTIINESPEPLVEYIVKTTLPVQRLSKRCSFLCDILEWDPGAWGADTMLLLSEHDRYLNVPGIVSRFKRMGLQSQIVVAPHWRHGGFVLQPDTEDVWRKHIISFLTDSTD